MEQKIAPGDCMTTKVVLKRRFDDGLQNTVSDAYASDP
jgi:hypothetical protein